MKKIIIVLIFILIANPLLSYAQTDISTSSESDSEVTIDTILADISDLIQRTRKNNKDKASLKVVSKLVNLQRRLDRSVKLTPPSKCNNLFKSATFDFYSLVSKLSEGISCGPSIISPNDLGPSSAQLVGVDCLPPSELHSQVTVSVFSECYGIYEKLRKLYNNDLNGSGITDVCE